MFVKLKKLVVVDDFVDTGLVLDFFGSLGKPEG
jgi:hypoxanthine phosphoribosyltransferase